MQRVCILPRPRSNERLYLIIFIRGGLKQMQLFLLDYIFMYICGIYNHVQKHLLSWVFILDFDMTLTVSLPCMKGYIERVGFTDTREFLKLKQILGCPMKSHSFGPELLRKVFRISLALEGLSVCHRPNL